MKLQDRGRWILDVKPDASISRTVEPTILDLDQAIDWIKKEKPLLWVGSLFSVPEPSNFPSGFALTSSLLDMLFSNSMPEKNRKQLIETLLSRWSLETLLDEFEFIGYDLSESLLKFFSDLNETVFPNTLHKAVVRYYQQGLAQQPLCVTTNWDTLLEKAFRQSGYKVVIGSVGKITDGDFGKAGADKTVFIYHPHGSFESKDVVCSAKQEQAQLPFSSEELIFHPILFLGYSGYEPSLYRKLENPAQHQLRCIRDNSDLDVPAKRRLLCRPNVSVYRGDLRELLLRLGVLEGEVNLQSKYIQNPGIPPKVLNLVSSSIYAAFDPNFCTTTLIENLQSSHDENESTIRYTIFMKALVYHIRNRISHLGVLPALLTSTLFRDSEQTWITTLAYMLRMNQDLDSKIISRLLEYANQAKEAAKDAGVFAMVDGHKFGESYSPDDAAVYGLGALNRTKIYKSCVGQGEKIDDVDFHYRASVISPDIGGEFIEILAFERLRKGNLESAKNLFDYAATSFYLRGFWHAGRLNEWASSNLESMIDSSEKNTLFIPAKTNI